MKINKWGLVLWIVMGIFGMVVNEWWTLSWVIGTYLWITFVQPEKEKSK